MQVGKYTDTVTTEQVATDYNSDDVVNDGVTDVPTDVPVADTIMEETTILESGRIGVSYK